MGCCIEAGTWFPFRVASFGRSAPMDECNILTKFVRFRIIPHIVTFKLMAKKWFPVDYHFSDRSSRSSYLANSNKAMTFKVCGDDIANLKAHHCVSPPHSLSAGDKSEHNIVIPIPVRPLSNVVVVNAVLEIKTGQVHVQSVMWPKILCVVARGNVGQLAT